MQNFWLDRKRDRETQEMATTSGILIPDEIVMKGILNCSPAQAKKYLDSVYRKKVSDIRKAMGTKPKLILP